MATLPAEPAVMAALAVPETGQPALPWLAAPLAAALARHRGHALLVHGAAGVGALHFALALAQAWLCESDADSDADDTRPRSHPRPCGRCGSCHLVQSKVHPDLALLMPQTLRRSLDWPLRDDKPDEDGKKKPSRQLRVDEVRGLIDWTQRTSGRGRGKVAVLHPAEAMNLQAGNALLKTLEEPPAGTRLVLTTSDPALLLPTVLSRCQHLRLLPPPATEASSWLAAQGVERPEVLLAAAGGRPLDALALSAAGIDAATWAALPRAVAAGRAEALAGWAVPQAVDALQKLCADALTRAAGGTARYFPDTALPRPGPARALLDWHEALSRVAAHAGHPWHEGLLIDALVAQGSTALAAGAQARIGSA